MTVNPGHASKLAAGTRFYRITSPAFNTPTPADHAKVVDGQGAKSNAAGARYNYPGAETVYLTEEPVTCLAERTYYMQREILRAIDRQHLIGVLPPFTKNYVLWEITFSRDFNHVFDFNIPGTATFAAVFPSLMLNPSQDYEHLKLKRAEIQALGYDGLRAPSTRCTRRGSMIVLFDDQSANVHAIRPYEVEIALVTAGPNPTWFNNHVTQILNFAGANFRFTNKPLPGFTSSNWQFIQFVR